MKLLAVLAVLAAALVALPAAAQQTPPPPSSPPPPPTYTPPPPPAAAPAASRSAVFVGARIGMYRPGGDTNVLDAFDFGSGLDLEGFVGLPLTPFLSLVGGIGYYQSSTDTLTAFDPQFGNVSASYELSAIPITASVRLGSTFDRVGLYAIGGVGYHLTTLKLKASAQGQSASQSEDDDVFGFHLGAGLSYAVTPVVSVGAEVRQTWVEGSYPNNVGLFGAGNTLKLDGLRIGATIAFVL